MKTTCVSFLAALLGLGLFTAPAHAAKTTTAAAAGVRFHIEHSAFEDFPYDNGDLSYAVAFEWHEADAYWQFVLGYAPDATATSNVEHVISPQINLMMKDDVWRGGLGAIWSFVEREDGDEDSDWLDVYWQFIFGVSLPIYGMNLDLNAYYVFEDWDKLDDFDLNDIEFGAWLGFQF